jgi:hypothetical protein
LEARPGTTVRFLVEATNWGLRAWTPGERADRAHLRASSEWPVQVQPADVELTPGHLHLAAVRVDVPVDALEGERVAVHVVLHGGARPAACDLEVVVGGDRKVTLPVSALRPIRRAGRT